MKEVKDMALMIQAENSEGDEDSINRVGNGGRFGPQHGSGNLTTGRAVAPKGKYDGVRKEARRAAWPQG